MRKQPPQIFVRFFRWFCNPDLHRFIEGDLFELYHKRMEQSGKRKADLRFILEVMLLFRPGIIGKHNNRYSSNPLIMIQYNFKIAVRSLLKNKASTFINVFGLTTGITSCLLIGLFIQHELSYDQFQPNGNRIARVIMEYKMDSSPDVNKGDFTSSKVAPVFSRTFPEVVKAIRMTDADMIVQNNETLVTEPRFVFVDSSFFDAFHAEMIEGNAAKALDGPNKVILSQSTALRYFHGEPALGKTLLMGSDKVPYEVTGVIKDYPETSQFRFDFLASFSSLHANQEITWYWANYTTYLLLTDQAAMESLQEKLHPFMEKEMKGKGSTIRFYLERFDKVHLHSPHQAMVPNTSVTYLYVLGAIAFLILAIVCFTYINLSTAKSVERAREVGVRKVSGAMKNQLFWQFIGESFVLCLLSVLVSFALAGMVLPYFNLLTDRTFIIYELFTMPFLLASFGAVLVVSVVAGAYPAVILSGLQPITVLKGVFKNKNSARWMQQSLIVFQFSITVFLIIATLVIQSQLNYIQYKSLGYDREHVLSIPIDYNMAYPQVVTLKNELKKNKDVLAISRTMNAPIRIVSRYSMRSATMDEKDWLSVNANPVDEEYITINSLELMAGSSFTEADMQDAAREDGGCYFILNESAARQLGWTAEEAIGQKMQLNREGVVRGVVKDFHFTSLHKGIKPLVLFSEPRGRLLEIKVSGQNMAEAIGSFERVWRQLVPTRPFEYHFLDEDYAALYKSEVQLGKIMNRFAGIAIILACLGLFGLSSYVIQQRMKEISIRKVMGASLFMLLKTLSGNFMTLICLSIVLAVPLAFVLMREWLNEFVYRIDLSGWVFVIAGSATILIALLTISIHAIRAAIANPVKSLRSE